MEGSLFEKDEYCVAFRS